jgi:uncharacterized protein YwgA
MAAAIRDVVAYICFNYPHRSELSKARLTKMVYLADWKAALDLGRQITPIRWIFNYYGPYVEDVIDSVRDDSGFAIIRTTNQYGTRKELVDINEGSLEWPSLDLENQAILDIVINETRPLFWNDFIKLVYSTYPVATQNRMSELDLVALAEEYKHNSGYFSAS